MDNPYPAPSADPASPMEGIRPEVNGTPMPPAKPAAPPPPAATLKEWAIYRLTQVGVLAALWVVAYLVLTNFQFRFTDAIILAGIVAVVASFFLKPLLPILSPAEKARAATAPDRTAPQQTDGFREVVETVVFVVVLVLMLKTFVAEAFVIPTGSMAETLYGYQKLVTCPSCGYEFPVNASDEVEGRNGVKIPVTSCTCPNCRQKIKLVPAVQKDGQMLAILETDKDRNPTRVEKFENLPYGTIPDPGWHSGDRVLVSKFAYDLTQQLPDRLDVVVFKFPGNTAEGFPQKSGPWNGQVPLNYIKRLVGLPGETIAIRRGKLFVLPPGKSPKYDDHETALGDPDKMAMLWTNGERDKDGVERRDHTHHNDPQAVKLFGQKDGGFTILRKPAAQVLSMMRIVYDNDHPAKDLTDKGQERWGDEDKSWAPFHNNATTFQKDERGFTHGATEDISWLRYRHVLRGDSKPSLITDFMGYNTGNGESHGGKNWASDLIVECKVKPAKAEGEVVLELSRGPDRFQARFNLATGECVLMREGVKEPLAKAATQMNKAGTTYAVRFANVDDRLLVWVDGKLPFGEGAPYEMAEKLVPTQKNDLDQPVSIGTNGDVSVSRIAVFRDTYYTANDNVSSPDVTDLDTSNANTFDKFADAPLATYYVQPDHFLCLGDNSPASSDGRTWGLVPRRLLLGKALLVYYPFSRGGRIR